MASQAELTELRRLVARLAIEYHHWRVAGFPDDHAYYLQVALFDLHLAELSRPESTQ